MQKSIPIKLVVADLDGTLLTPDKGITAEAEQAVQELGKAGILFTLVSGRPPFGMRQYSDSLKVRLPICGFNGGEIANPDFSCVERLTIPEKVTQEIEKYLSDKGVAFWIYRGSDWIVNSPDLPHIKKEATNVAFTPSVVPSYDGIWKGVTKIVGISDDHDYLASCENEARKVFAGKASAARSQPYYLDITHPHATKEVFIEYLAQRLMIPRSQIATIGDMPSDVPMFSSCGLSIAMGNASDSVKAAANHVTRSNQEEGFAYAMRELVLTRQSKAA